MFSPIFDFQTMEQSQFSFQIPFELRQIGQAIAKAGGRPVLVGGWVRDHFLDQPHVKDFDIEVFGLDSKRLKRVLKEFGPVHGVGRHFGVLKLNTQDAEYDVSIPRREVKTGKGHKGFLIDTDPEMSFKEAAARRDFTINSMGFAFLENQLEDHYGGLEDLQNRTLRHVGPAFGEDPLRVLRAMQFAGRFNLNIVPETIAICQAQALKELPKERLWEEFRKLFLKAEKPSLGLKWMKPLGILPYFPDLERLFSGPHWDATLRTVDAAAALPHLHETDSLELICAAVGHRMGDNLGGKASAEQTRQWLEGLTNETRFLEKTTALVQELPVVFSPVEPKTIDSILRRLALRVSLPQMDRLYQACVASEGKSENHPESSEADGRIKTKPIGDGLQARAVELGIWESPPKPLLKGRHLQAMGMEPGKTMGELLKEAFETQLDGGFSLEEEAIAWAHSKIENN